MIKFYVDLCNEQLIPHDVTRLLINLTDGVD